MKKLFFILTFVVSATLSAQVQVEWRFNETEHNFGTIYENEGEVSHRFLFQNTGTTAFKVQQVTASCGCTTPSWTLASIEPGDTASILVVFDPKDRPGKFEKSVRVVFETVSGQMSETLDIQGVVIERQDKAEDVFPFQIGQIRLRETVVDFGEQLKGEVAQRNLELMNAADEPLRLQFVSPNFVVIESPAVLKPNETTQITLKYLTKLSEKWSNSSETIQLFANGERQGEISTQIVVIEDFSKLTPAQHASAPVAILATKLVNAGNVKIGKKVTAKFEISNVGNDPLLIREVKTGCNYLSAKSPKQVKGGKKAVIKLEIDATNLQTYKFSKILQIITNDPTNPIQHIQVVWNTVR